LLSQIPAGIAREDRHTLLGEESEAAAECLYALALAKWSEGSDRLDLLPPIRHVAQKDYPPDDADSLAWQRHYLALAKEQGSLLRRSEAVQASLRIVPEIANIDAAINAAVAAGRPEDAGPMADGYGRAQRLTGLGGTIVLRSAANACVRSNHLSDAALCFCALGEIELLRSDHEAARRDHEHALALARQATDEPALAHCLRGLADLDRMESDKRDAARTGYTQARVLYERLGADLGKAHCLRGLADLDSMESDKRDAARTGYTQAQVLYERLGDDLGKANCLWGLAELAAADGDRRSACSLYADAEKLYRANGRADWMAWIAWKMRSLGCRSGD
jgi:tetratricopeptide (TPR) repeat protein